MHIYEVRPRKDHRGFDLISDALPFGRLWYGELNAVSNAIDYAKFGEETASRLPKTREDEPSAVRPPRERGT
jgi:hypothetical protein